MNRFVVLIILTIFIVPLAGVIPIQGQSLWCPQYLALFFCFFLGVIVSLWRFNKFLSLFLAVCLYSTFFTAKGDARAIMLLVQLNFGCLMAYGISKFNEKQRKYVLYAILGLVMVQCLWLIVQSLNIDPFFSKVIRTAGGSGDVTKIAYGVNDLVGFSGSKAQLGAFFAIIASLGLLLNPILLLVPLLGIALCKTSFSMLAFLSVFIGLWFLYRKYFYIGLISFLIVGGVFFGFIDKPHIDQFKARFGVWEHSIQSVVKGEITLHNRDTVFIAKINPWVGVGFGQFLNIFPYVPTDFKNCFNYDGERFTHAHNDFVEFFFETGFIGLFALLLLLGNFIFTFVVSLKTRETVVYFSCICAFLLNAIGNFPSQLAISGMLLIIFYGMFEGSRI